MDWLGATALGRQSLVELAQPSLARIVEHSLEKNPADRFQSARDVAFALDAFSGSSSSKVAAISGSGRTGFWQKRPAGKAGRPNFRA